MKRLNYHFHIKQNHNKPQKQKHQNLRCSISQSLHINFHIIKQKSSKTLQKTQQNQMRPEEQQSDRSNINNQLDTMDSKLNQSLLIQSNFILFLLIVLSLLVNATYGYGYNVAIGCGIYFLSTKHPFLYRMFYFYMMVFLTILADGITVTLLYKKVSVFHWIIAPVIQIILKLVLLAFEGMRWYRQVKQEKQRLKNQQQNDSQLRNKIQEDRVFQMEQNKYLTEKKHKKVNPSSYYQPKNQKSRQHKPNYKSQAYRQFDFQQFIEEEQNAAQSVRR